MIIFLNNNIWSNIILFIIIISKLFHKNSPLYKGCKINSDIQYSRANHSVWKIAETILENLSYQEQVRNMNWKRQ